MTGSPTAGTAPAGAVPVASVSSPPVGLLVERMLTESDDDLAEALAHRTAVGAHQPGTFAGGATATTEAVKGLGLDVDRAAPPRRQRALSRRPGPGQAPGRGARDRSQRQAGRCRAQPC